MEIQKREESAVSVMNMEALEAIREFEQAVKKKHRKISEKKTNKNHVKQKAGMDFVEWAYMKSQVNENYPIWSTKNLVIKHELISAGWIVVQFDLVFYDEGVPRTGVCAAAHRIAFKTGQTRTPENIVDLSNDVKAAVTDALKKGFNTYMNISDDIYRQIEIEDISAGQKKLLYDIVSDCEPSQQASFYSFIDNSVSRSNLTEITLKLLKAYYNFTSRTKGEEEAKKGYQSHKDLAIKNQINID